MMIQKLIFWLPVIEIFIFADDTIIIFAHKTLKELQQVVNSELSKVSEW